MSVGRKKLSVCKRMLPLFRAVVKFCSTNRLFKYNFTSFFHFRFSIEKVFNTAYSNYVFRPVVISKNFNKGGSRHNHTHSLGVAQLQPRPYFKRWRHDNLV